MSKDSPSVETIKAESNYLRGTIQKELRNEASAFSEEAAQLLKHHGTYQQYDRDVPLPKGKGMSDAAKVYAMMIRTKLPGGRLTAAQLLAELDLCDSLGNGTLRITNRQGLQLHGILKRNLRAAIRGIIEARMTTLGACGDVERNVLCCPAPYRGRPLYDQLQTFAAELSDRLLPRTRAYPEIWLEDSETGQTQCITAAESAEEVEPLYGKTYLPRKFKAAITLPEDNCIDVYANDLGLIAIREGDQWVGFNVLVGGGFGVSPGKKNTFPILAQRLCYVERARAIDLAIAILTVQRDHGNRENRKRARLKYLLADWGLERFQTAVEAVYGRALEPLRPEDVVGYEDHIGWHEQGDGRWFLGLNVENGRILDREGFTLKTALREICQTYAPEIRLTGCQSMLFADIAADDRAGLEAMLRRHGVKLDDEVSVARRLSMACVALPTCPLALTESERVLPRVIDQLETALSHLGLSEERFTLRMTGCPNGCARPYHADIGLVGRTKDKYTLYLGGRLIGDRMASAYQDLVATDEIVATLHPLLTYFSEARTPGEALGDFFARKGGADLRAYSDSFAQRPA